MVAAIHQEVVDRVGDSEAVDCSSLHDLQEFDREPVTVARRWASGTLSRPRPTVPKRPIPAFVRDRIVTRSRTAASRICQVPPVCPAGLIWQATFVNKWQFKQAWLKNRAFWSHWGGSCIAFSSRKAAHFLLPLWKAEIRKALTDRFFSNLTVAVDWQTAGAAILEVSTPTPRSSEHPA